MKKTLVLLIAIACALIASAPVKAQSYYYQLGLDSFYGNTLPPVGSDAYYWFWRGEQENDPYCARLLVAGMILIDPHPENNVSEIVQMINKWYKKDEKISLLASSFYLPPVLDFNPGTIMLHGNIKYDYKNGVKNDWSKALYYAKYAYEKQNTGDGDADRFYNRLLSVCYRDGIGGYDQNIRKAAKLAASTGDNSLLPLVFADARTLLDLYNILEECLPSEVNRFDDSSSYLSWWSNFAQKRETFTADFFNLSADRMSAVYYSLPSIVQAWLDSNLKGRTGEILLIYPNREIVLAEQKSRSDSFISNLRAAFFNHGNEREPYDARTINRVKIRNAFAEAKDLESKCLLAEGTMASAKALVSNYFTKQAQGLGTLQSSASAMADAVVSLADEVSSISAELFADDPAIGRCRKVAAQVKAFFRAQASGTSAAYDKFLRENTDAPAEYLTAARSLYNSTLAQEQDNAAFEAAFALTKAPSPLQKESILAMPMSSSMRETVEQMLRPKYIRQHNKSTNPPSFRDATLNHFSGIDMSYWWENVSVGGNWLIGGINSGDLGYSIVGLNIGASYDFKFTPLYGMEAGLYYAYEHGSYSDDEAGISIDNALNQHFFEVPLYFTLNYDWGDGEYGLLFAGLITRAGLGASGWYAGMKRTNLYRETDFFKPFDIRPAIGCGWDVEFMRFTASLDWGTTQSGAGTTDFRFRIGASYLF